ncbi:hypothetical protein CAEBREN_24507 [Caenorhabditis brenneri]|uniref:F-box domain-containing protein n=1 Tax=Caenorhabditis brenneri TaxID=135651 RepID=G0MII6_CAEBE|nr:hypothetical protein CAEBREN_24507 [Caenorhabditis brenneri]
MSFPLRRLPLLAIREVIKSMNTKEMFLFSLASKKSANFVMSSIPKNSLSAEFTFQRDGFLFELMPKGFRKQAVDILPEVSYKTENESMLTRFSICGLYVQCKWTGTSEVEESTRKLFHRFSKTFNKSELYMKFEDGTSEEFAIELTKFTWENGFPLNQIDFYLKNASPESIQELLNGCNEHHTSLDIETKIPKDSKCTPPPGGYKFETLGVEYAHWVNLDDFLQCRRLFFIKGLPGLTVEYLNGLLMKIVNLECRLERFIFDMNSIKPSDFPEIVRGLSESAIQQDGAWQGLQFERKDGLELLVSLSNGYLDLEEDYL